MEEKTYTCIYMDDTDTLNLNFFLNSDGSCNFFGTNAKWFPEELKHNVNISNIENPYNFFKDIFESTTNKYMEMTI